MAWTASSSKRSLGFLGELPDYISTVPQETIIQNRPRSSMKMMAGGIFKSVHGSYRSHGQEQLNPDITCIKGWWMKERKVTLKPLEITLKVADHGTS